MLSKIPAVSTTKIHHACAIHAGHPTLPVDLAALGTLCSERAAPFSDSSRQWPVMTLAAICWHELGWSRIMVCPCCNWRLFEALVNTGAILLRKTSSSMRPTVNDSTLLDRERFNGKHKQTWPEQRLACWTGIPGKSLSGSAQQAIGLLSSMQKL
jgi:hypothetical protein